MEKMTKEEFKRKMREAEIERRINEADAKPIDDEEEAVAKYNHQLAMDIKATITKAKPGRKRGPKPKAETPKRRPGRPKKTEAAAVPEKPKETKVAAVPKKPGRKPKAEKFQEAAVQIASKTMDEAIDKAAKQEESLRFLIGVARGRTSEIIHNSEAHIKTAGKLADLAEVYDAHIRRVEEMLK